MLARTATASDRAMHARLATLIAALATGCGPGPERLPAFIPVSVETTMDASSAWHESRWPPPPGPMENPFVQAECWEHDRILLTVSHFQGKEAERVRCSLPLGQGVAVAETVALWEEDSNGVGPEFATELRGVVRIDAG